MEQNIEIIRKACIEANPDIKSKYHVSTGNNLRCSLCGELDNYDNAGKCQNGVIRPIRLADILLAIAKFGDYYTIDVDGRFIFGKEWIKESNDVLALTWNLRKDSLTDQSEETITFLANLLK
jgi:hypothetical protein